MLLQGKFTYPGKYADVIFCIAEIYCMHIYIVLTRSISM